MTGPKKERKATARKLAKEIKKEILKPPGTADIGNVTALIKAGASLDDYNIWGETLLVQAIKYGQTQIALALIEGGADIDRADGNSRYSPLQMAAQTGNAEIAKVLLEKGADLENNRFRNGTSLSKALQYGHRDIAKMIELEDLRRKALEIERRYAPEPEKNTNPDAAPARKKGFSL